MTNQVIGTRTLFVSAARTATPAPVTQNDENHPRLGCQVIIDVTAASSPSVVPAVEGFDLLSQKWYALLTGAAITATGTTVLRVYPGVVPTENQAASDFLPPVWRVTMTHGNGNSVTYSVSATLR